MKIGYARISTEDQNLNLQIDALEKHGCEKIFSECVSGARRDRVQLQAAIEYMRANDTLVIWKLDRLIRSLSHLVELMKLFEQKDFNICSIQEGFDSSTQAGTFTMHILGSLAEMERNIIIERTREGVRAAKKRGVHCGRKYKLDTAQKKQVLQLFDNPDNSIKDIAATFNIGKSTVYKYVWESQNGIKPKNPNKIKRNSKLRKLSKEQKVA